MKIVRLSETTKPLGKGRALSGHGWRMTGGSGETFVVTLPSKMARENWIRAVRVLVEGSGRKLNPNELERVAAAAAMTLQHGPFSPAGKLAEGLLHTLRVELPVALCDLWASEACGLTALRFTRALGRALDLVLGARRGPDGCPPSRVAAAQDGMAKLAPPRGRDVER